MSAVILLSSESVWCVLLPKVFLLFLSGCLLLCDNCDAQFSNDWFEGAIYWHYVWFKAQENYIRNARKTQNCFLWQCHEMTQTPGSDTHCSELLHTTLYKCGTIRYTFRCNIPEQCRSHLLYGRSMKPCTVNYSLYFNLISLTGRPRPIEGNFTDCPMWVQARTFRNENNSGYKWLLWDLKAGS